MLRADGLVGSSDLTIGVHQRARGELVVSFKRRDGASVLDRLRQDGCLKARFPRAQGGVGGGGDAQ